MIWKILKKEELDVMLPYTLNHLNIYSLVNSVLDENFDARCERINFDFSRLSFVEPDGVTVLSNLIEFLKKSKVKTGFKNHDTPSKDAIGYLDDSGFFKQYLGKSIKTHAMARPTTLPLNLVDYTRSYEYMELKLIPWLSRALLCNEPSLATLKVCFQEIFNNIKDHSTERIACSFAQHYPQKRLIKISISDFGIGIPANVKKKTGDISDHEAINAACREGFTTQSTHRNRGAGLDVLIKNVVSKNSGTVFIRSLKGILSCTKQGAIVKRSAKPSPGFYPGTLIQIILDTGKFVSDEPEEVFEW